MALAALAHHPLVVVGRTRTITEVARLMDEHHARLVVVTDGDRLAGVVTDRDIIVRGVARRYPADARIESVMSTDVASLPAGASPAEAMAAFRDAEVRHLPLVDGTEVVAVLSAEDLLVEYAEEATRMMETLDAAPTDRPA